MTNRDIFSVNVPKKKKTTDVADRKILQGETTHKGMAYYKAVKIKDIKPIEKKTKKIEKVQGHHSARDGKFIDDRRNL